MMEKNWTMNPKMFAERAKAIYDKFAPKWKIFGLDERLAMIMRQGVLLLVMLGALQHPIPAFAQESELAKRVAELSDRLAFASKGQILSVKEDQVYLDMGEQAGIAEGTRFEVVRLGEPLLVGGKVVGHEETIIGEIEVLRVREGSAIAKMVKKEQPFEKGDRVYQLKKKVQRVAVAEFPYGGTFNDFTKNVQDMLYTSLTQKGMIVVERQKLEEVLREQKIAYTGIIDLATAAQVGKQLGVEGMVVGSVADLGNSVALTARLVDVEKGASITASRVELPKTTEMGALLGRGSRGMLAKEPVDPGSPPKDIKKSLQDFYFEDFSGIPKGTIPADWLGGEALAVVSKGSGNELTNFEVRSDLYIQTAKIPFPPDYDLEIVLWWDYGFFHIQLGKLMIYMRDTGYIKIGNSEMELRRALHNNPLTLLIQKRGKVYSFHIDTAEVLVARYDNIDFNSIAFTNKNVDHPTRHFGIRRISGKTVQ